MNSITRNIGKTISLISSSIYRPFYKYTAKDLIRYTTSFKELKIPENTDCETILHIMEQEKISSVTVIDKKKKSIGYLDYNIVKDVVDFQNFHREETIKDRDDTKRYSGN